MVLTGAGTLSNQTTTGVTYIAPNPVSMCAPNRRGNVYSQFHCHCIDANRHRARGHCSERRAHLGQRRPADDREPSGDLYQRGFYQRLTLLSPPTALPDYPDILVDTGSFGLRLLASQVQFRSRP